MVFMAVASSLGLATPAGILLPPPPKKNFPGEVRGYQEPSGARQTGQYMTGQYMGPPAPDESPRTRQDKVFFFLNVPVGTTRQTRHSWP